MKTPYDIDNDCPVCGGPCFPGECERKLHHDPEDDGSCVRGIFSGIGLTCAFGCGIGTVAPFVAGWFAGLLGIIAVITLVAAARMKA